MTFLMILASTRRGPLNRVLEVVDLFFTEWAGSIVFDVLDFGAIIGAVNFRWVVMMLFRGRMSEFP